MSGIPTFCISIAISPPPIGAAETPLDPDQVRASKRDAGVILFFRWYPDVGKYVVVVVNIENPARRWLITAHFARKSDGDLLWTKS